MVVGVFPQTVSNKGETETVAAGLTVSVTELLALQLPELVTVTVYVVVAFGETVIAAVVPELLQL